MVVGDTAGLRFGDIGDGGTGNVVGGIEKKGIRRARKRVMEGDVVVCVNKMDLLQEYPTPPDGLLPPIPDDWRDMVMATFPALSEDAIVGISCYDSKASKFDSDDPDFGDIEFDDTYFGEAGFEDTTSLWSGSPVQTTEANIQPLFSTLISLFARMTTSSAPEAKDSLAGTTRQRLLVESCLRYLDRYFEMVLVDCYASVAEDMNGDEGRGVDVVLAAEELRSGAGCLKVLFGEVSRGHVRGGIFS
ncbi:hypothetical protein L211DRAFT_533615 [Terfezia boudieri ATCC MYA-4762]|uniref:Uncharacterized protein n=1 Tax=Terfezia boudieri ATCC MYA-4762 TaxID=1051890 RepID=A0A3N4LF16_9PEZI|nr:hypothetical protein L211DRAFT_533615 [Terfezia boudieri ATCC MYA-4762]